DAAVIAADGVGDGLADLFAVVVAGRAEADGYEGELAEEVLQKRELHFQRVLARVRAPVLGQQLGALHERARQRRVDGRVAERRVPRAVAVDGGEVPGAGVVRAEDDEALRQLRRDVERRGDVAAVHQPRVRNDGADEAGLRRRRGVLGDARLHLLAQPRGTRLVERAGDGRRASGHGGAS